MLQNLKKMHMNIIFVSISMQMLTIHENSFKRCQILKINENATKSLKLNKQNDTKSLNIKQMLSNIEIQ